MKIVKSKSRNFFTLAGTSVLFLLVTAVFPYRWCLAVLRCPENFNIAHLTAYGVLSFFWCIFLRSQRQLAGFRLSLISVISLSLLITALCGGVTEMMQAMTPSRRPDFQDFIYDMIGGLAGSLLFLLQRTVMILRCPKPVLARG